MFYLKTVKNSDKGNIYLHYRKKNINVKYYLNESVEVDAWDNSLHRIKQSNGYPWKKINRKIDQVEEYILSLTESENDSEKIKNELARRFGGKYIDKTDFIEYSNLPILSSFRSSLSFSDVNYAFMSELASWLEKTVSEKTGKKYRSYYIAWILSMVRQKYNKAVREGLAKPADLNFKYKSYQDEITNVYLSESELDKIKNTPMTGAKKAQREVVKDWFLIGCYTGLRVGNYLNLVNCTINRDQNYLEAVVNKNGPVVRIPLHRTVLEILDRWGDNIPVPPKVNGFNKTIRTVVKMAGITDKIFVVRRIGGERIVEQVEKYKLVSSHTARRSLATNLYLRNVPIRFIMSLTGHKTEAMCLRYIKAGINDMYDKVAALDFWK